MSDGENLIDRDAIITTLFWMSQGIGQPPTKDANGNPTLLIDKMALNVNKNTAIRMTDGEDCVRITLVGKG